MGGNLFKLGRIPRERYLEIEAEVRQTLDQIAPGNYRIPRYYNSKADFGDLDVVLSSGAFKSWDAFKELLVERFELRRYQSTGPVFSTVYRDFQVDYFVRDPQYFLTTYNFLSFNDIGNLLGKMFRRFNLKYGERGLAYVFRRASQESYKRDLEVCRDPHRIFAFLELDGAVWEEGFEDLEAMFDWVLTSPYFSARPYLDPSPATRKRIRERTTLQRFVAYLEERGHYIYSDTPSGTPTPKPRISAKAHPGNKDDYLPRIAAAFPEAGLLEAIAREKRLEAEDLELAEKLNGRLVAEWTGLAGKDLGILMRRIHETWDREDLLAMSAAKIREEVLELNRG